MLLGLSKINNPAWYNQHKFYLFRFIPYFFPVSFGISNTNMQLCCSFEAIVYIYQTLAQTGSCCRMLSPAFLCTVCTGFPPSRLHG